MADLLVSEHVEERNIVDATLVGIPSSSEIMMVREGQHFREAPHSPAAQYLPDTGQVLSLLGSGICVPAAGAMHHHASICFVLAMTM